MLCSCEACRACGTEKTNVELEKLPLWQSIGTLAPSCGPHWYWIATDGRGCRTSKRTICDLFMQAAE